MQRIKEQYTSNILIAEDSEDDYLFTFRALTHKGFSKDHLIRVKDGDELIEYLSNNIENTPDLILLDLSMPKMDGYEALKEIKKDSRLKGIPVIVLSGSGTMEDRNKSLELGANWFIEKPSSLYAYIHAVAGACQYWAITFQRLKNAHRDNN